MRGVILFLSGVMTADHTEQETFRWALKNGGILTYKDGGRALQKGLCPHVGDQESEFVFKENTSDLI